MGIAFGSTKPDRRYWGTSPGACHAEGRGFESLHPLHRKPRLGGVFCCLCSSQHTLQLVVSLRGRRRRSRSPDAGDARRRIDLRRRRGLAYRLSAGAALSVASCSGSAGEDRRRSAGVSGAPASRAERKLEVTNAVGSARESSAEVPDGLDWERFRVAYFPGSRRHNLEAIVAYGAYRRLRAVEPSSSQPACGQRNPHERGQSGSGFARRNTARGVSMFAPSASGHDGPSAWPVLEPPRFFFSSLVAPPARAQQGFIWTFLH